MSEEKKTDDFVNVTDCLEAIGVFKSMKNFLFLIVFICIIGLGVCFWITDFGLVSNPNAQPLQEQVVIENVDQVVDEEAAEVIEAANIVVADVNSTNAAVVEKAAEKVLSEPNGLPLLSAEVKESANGFKIKYIIVARVVRVFNFVLVLSSIMYCLTMMFCLKVSLVGRLGGINHISRAFFCSLFILVFIFPWQKFFGTDYPIVVGAIYLPAELKMAFADKAAMSLFSMVLYYMRFFLWWVIVVILLLASQRRSAKWSNSVLRRLGIEQ